MSSRTLYDLPRGASAVVVRIDGSGPLKQRLMEMGFVRGATVRAEQTAPMGDPRAYAVGDYRLSLRNQEARAVYVEDIDG